MSYLKDSNGQTITTSNGQAPYGTGSTVTIHNSNGTTSQGTIHSGGYAVKNK
ncbi:hypothetical protein [Tritonibacter mobilis]|jgi:hypothetical protein|uniref:hypothetical protein n=1 Tax=Tritonibacter mobilis TaxID=379347 RepID=UPI0013B460DA|nr:hypothetical protein [Tritonibacter mobilis]